MKNGRRREAVCPQAFQLGEGHEIPERTTRRGFAVSDGFWLLHADGASLGNPGPGGAGAVIYDDQGRLAAEISHSLGPAVTNNEAEYQALLLGLDRLRALGARKIRIRLDSELIVRQVKGDYQVKSPRLAGLFRQAMDLMAGFEICDIAHVRRELNREADALAGRAAASGRTGPAGG
jgi:ribonuclease HI